MINVKMDCGMIKKNMKWIALRELNQIDKIIEESTEHRILIFKHSTSCSTSRMVLDRMERSWMEEEMVNVKPYFLDLLSFRSLSNAVAQKFDVDHQSPQVLIIEKGESIYTESHFGIDYKNLKSLSSGF